MAILDRLKPLFAKSRLLVDIEEYEKELAEINKLKGGKRWRKRGRVSRPGDRPKLGQGGTLDPLADGVLVLGVNKGTKVLGQFLECSKEYRTTALLGCETDSYDSKGARVHLAPYTHLTRDDVENVLNRFRGDIQQMPPIFSALKMDGKPLYEYARENKPLPRPIEARKCTVHELVLESWIPAATSSADTTGHHFHWPEKEIDDEQREARKRVAELVLKAETDAHPTEEQPAVTNALRQDTPLPASADYANLPGPPAFVLRMSVSSGTYVRSIVHDVGVALGSAAHVVTLTRTRQGKYGLAGASRPESVEPEVQAPVSFEVERPELMDGNCVKWEVFERALEKLEGGDEIVAKPEDEWEDWEQAIIQSWSEN
ncbi:hypothetical protein FS749_004416 [Ceratobasidium sp. UAMH 11750]|nr:hypothetical protein FS749_004416 [Ceratobasidium sp. UAMH 11750]